MHIVMIKETGQLLGRASFHGMDCSKISIFEQPNQVCFSRFLQRPNGGCLETDVLVAFLGNLADEALKKELADE